MAEKYQTISDSLVLRTADGARIPDDKRNSDYMDYLVWVAAGNTPDAAPTAVVSLIQQAKTALAATDTTMLRIADAVAVGKTTWTTEDVAAWAAYRRALREIVNGTDTTSTVLPVAPAYPANT